LDRLFLDANVLFSAAYREGAGIERLWKIDRARLFSSGYAVDEAERNLAGPAQRSRLEELLTSLELVPTMMIPPALREDIELPEKDWPIIGGAISAEATHLITGDLSHFGPYFHKRVRGILVLPPAAYIRDADRTF
jgi:predicted nucleic acid-binding protein